MANIVNYAALATGVSELKRDHAEAFNLSTGNAENQPAQQRLRTPESVPATFTGPAALKRPHAEAFGLTAGETEMQPVAKRVRTPLAPVTNNTTVAVVENDEDDDVDSLFNDNREENGDNDSLFNDDGDEDDFLSSQELEAAIAAAKAEEEAKKQAEETAIRRAIHEQRVAEKAAQRAREKAAAQAAAAAEEAERVARCAVVDRAKAKRAKQMAKERAKAKAKEDAKARVDAAEAWSKHLANRRRVGPNTLKATAPINSTKPMVIDLTDDEPAASPANLMGGRNRSESSKEVIDLSGDDSVASSDAKQSNSPSTPERGDEAAELRVPPPEHRPFLASDVKFEYNSNGFPLQQAIMASRRATKEEREAYPQLGGHVRGLLFPQPETLAMDRDQLKLVVAHTSVSIIGQKGVQDAVDPLVESLFHEELESIRYVDGAMHNISDFKRFANKIKEKGAILAAEELRLQPTWLWKHPDLHKAVCKRQACRDESCRKQKLHYRPNFDAHTPEVRGVNVDGLLGALRTPMGHDLFGSEVLPVGVRTLSECLASTLR